MTDDDDTPSHLLLPVLPLRDVCLFPEASLALLVTEPGGIMALVVPDERERDTIALDPTHKHCFTPESLDRYLDLIGGMEKVESKVVVKTWSFLAVYRKR